MWETCFHLWLVFLGSLQWLLSSYHTISEPLLLAFQVALQSLTLLTRFSTPPPPRPDLGPRSPSCQQRCAHLCSPPQPPTQLWMSLFLFCLTKKSPQKLPRRFLWLFTPSFPCPRDGCGQPCVQDYTFSLECSSEPSDIRIKKWWQWSPKETPHQFCILLQGHLPTHCCPNSNWCHPLYWYL